MAAKAVAMELGEPEPEATSEVEDSNTVWGADPVNYNALPPAGMDGPRRQGPPKYAYPEQLTQAEATQPDAQTSQGFEYGPQTVPLLVGGDFVPFLLPSAN